MPFGPIPEDLCFRFFVGGIPGKNGLGAANFYKNGRSQVPNLPQDPDPQNRKIGKMVRPFSQHEQRHIIIHPSHRLFLCDLSLSSTTTPWQPGTRPRKTLSLAHSKPCCYGLASQKVVAIAAMQCCRGFCAQPAMRLSLCWRGSLCNGAGAGGYIAGTGRELEGATGVASVYEKTD